VSPYSEWATKQAESICRYAPCNPEAHIAEAIDAAFKAGVEAAAKVCDDQIPRAAALEKHNLGLPESAACRELARRIRLLTPETKP
jgi:5-formyltetrahydrofolate cyclo-ligase